MCLNLKKILFTILYIVSTSTCLALPSDSEQTMYIVADSTLFNYKTGVDTYEGNVKVDQGTTHLIADRLVTEKNEHKTIVSAIAYGLQSLAEFETQPNKGDKILHAKAKVIKFYPSTSTVILEDNVVVTHGENSFNGPIIIYNMKDQIVAAPTSKSGRATIVIDPKQKS